MRNILSYVPHSARASVAADLTPIFQAHRADTARLLVEDFCQRYERAFPSAVKCLRRGLDDALAFMAFPTAHHKFLRTTNLLERLFKEVKRRTRVVGVFPSETSATNLATTVMLRVSQDWALRRYLDMAPLHALDDQPTISAT